MQYTVTPGARGICPYGWHIPTLAEYAILSDTVGGDANALKAIGQGKGSGSGTDTSGFSALLAGRRDISGDFNNLSRVALFWSSTEYDSTYAWNMLLSIYGMLVSVSPDGKEYGLSLRCLQD